MDDTENPPGSDAPADADAEHGLYDQEVDPAPAPAPAVDAVEAVEAVPAVEGDEPDDRTLAERAAQRLTPAWVGTLTGAGLGLAVVQGLVLLGLFAQGLADKRFTGDVFHKIGVALFGIEAGDGLMLVAAAVVAGLPTVLGAPSTETHRRRRALTYGLVTVLAVLLVVGTPLAVRARVHVLDLNQQSVDPLTRRMLATYIVGALGTALVALATALGLARLNQAEPVDDEPSEDLPLALSGD